jgi:hypothetical protein
MIHYQSAKTAHHCLLLLMSPRTSDSYQQKQPRNTIKRIFDNKPSYCWEDHTMAVCSKTAPMLVMIKTFPYKIKVPGYNRSFVIKFS